MTQAHPLHWPPGWPRTKDSGKKPFLGTVAGQSWNHVIKRLNEELRRLGAQHVVISTNMAIRNDGIPYAQQRRIDDTGAAVYFSLGGKQFVIAQDRYYDLSDNIRSIAIAIEHMRGLERHGGGQMMSRAFAGFEALPAPGAATRRTWRQVLGVEGTVSRETVDAKFKTLARQHHPDNGGSHDAMAELNAAIEEARRELGNG